MQQEHQEILDQIINAGRKALLENPSLSKDAFHKLKNEIYSHYDIAKPFPSIRILERYDSRVAAGEFSEDDRFRKLLRKRGVRSLSGVTVISLLTKFWGCPGKCIYCPTFEGLPKSYIPSEPAVMRAELNAFDPILQIHNRLRGLEVTGHKIEKNDVRIIGGTWSFYPKSYQETFIKGIYDAFNSYYDMKPFIEKTDFSQDKFASFKLCEGFKMYESKTLEEAISRNQSAKCRVIGIAIETRPDWITPEEIVRLRKYGVTRVEIGYQTTIDEINEKNKRGHGNYESIGATKMLKDAGFKVVAHMMPNLLGSTPEQDREAMKICFENPLFRPDELKIYPMMVTENSELTEIWKQGNFQAYDDETLINLMTDLELLIPEYVRINRTYRDIPADEILHGSTLSNLRQFVENKIHQKGKKLLDIRSREIKDKDNDPEKAVLHSYEYEASDGKEYFLTFEDPEDRTIFSLLRLRIPSSIYKPNSQQIFEMRTEASLNMGKREIHKTSLPHSTHKILHPIPLLPGEGTSYSVPVSSSPLAGENGERCCEEEILGGKQVGISDYLPELAGAALIREIHTFGDQLSIGEKGSQFGQHIGFGKRLIETAEKIAKEKYHLSKIAVIAGVGVRAYYEKRGYHLEGTYMVKEI